MSKNKKFIKIKKNKKAPLLSCELDNNGAFLRYSF